MGDGLSHHIHLGPKFCPPGGDTGSPGCLLSPVQQDSPHPSPFTRSHQLSYYLSRHKPNYRPCPAGAVGFMRRVRRQSQAGVNPPTSPPFFPPSLKTPPLPPKPTPVSSPAMVLEIFSLLCFLKNAPSRVPAIHTHPGCFLSPCEDLLPSPQGSD